MADNSVTKCFLLAGIYDKPAKAKMLNMKSYNGFYGCTKCLQPGISFRGGQNNKGGVIHIYPYQPRDPKGTTKNKSKV